MKIIITADVPEDITEDEMIMLYDAMAQLGADNIRVESEEKE